MRFVCNGFWDEHASGGELFAREADQKPEALVTDRSLRSEKADRQAPSRNEGVDISCLAAGLPPGRASAARSGPAR